MHKYEIPHDTIENGILSNNKEIPTCSRKKILTLMSFIPIIFSYTSCNTLFMITFTKFDIVKSNNTYTHDVLTKSNSMHTNDVTEKFKWMVHN